VAASGTFLAELEANGILVPSGVDGVFARGRIFEDVLLAFDRIVDRAAAADGATRLHFPPLLPRRVVESTGYLRSFPNLLGLVHSFTGGDPEHRALLAAFESGGDWSGSLAPTDLALAPAACHPIYPLATGTLPSGGLRYEVVGWCFRHEPSPDPARLQSFRMHEVVQLGDADAALAFRDGWVGRGQELLASVGLAAEAVPANDPFFGRAGRLLAAGQRDSGLKVELVVPITSTENPTAIASANAHGDHFGEAFAIHTADGEVAHTACVGFGLERVTLALLRHHGLDPASWPAAVRSALWP
jgi:seryl-tRNA synthetase